MKPRLKYVLLRVKFCVPFNAHIDFQLPLRTEILSVLVANSLCFMLMLQLFEVKTKIELCTQSEKQLVTSLTAVKHKVTLN